MIYWVKVLETYNSVSHNLPQIFKNAYKSESFGLTGLDKLETRNIFVGPLSHTSKGGKGKECFPPKFSIIQLDCPL